MNQKSAVVYVGASQKCSRRKQEGMCRAYANRNGLKVLTVFREKFNAFELVKRKALRWMRLYLRNNEDVKYILVHKENDIAHNASELFLITKFLQGSNAEFLFLVETPHPNF